LANVADPLPASVVTATCAPIPLAVAVFVDEAEEKHWVTVAPFEAGAHPVALTVCLRGLVHPACEYSVTVKKPEGPQVASTLGGGPPAAFTADGAKEMHVFSESVRNTW
jgi:hypothetical protein